MAYSTDKTKIAVLGSGNIGTQFSCVCAAKGYKVNLFSSRPEMFDGVLETIDEFGNTTIGKINKVTNVLQEALEDCSVVFVAYPAFKLPEIAEQMYPFIHRGLDICVLPGTGGAEFAFRECMKAGAVLYGLQRVPTVARLEKYGKRVRCEGLRPELFLASIPGKPAKGFSSFLSGLWAIPCHVLPNYLCVTLTPSNPILHTARLRNLFSDYDEGKIYDKNPLFYGEWDDASSGLLFSCDEELQGLLKVMNKLDLHDVRSLKLHYKSNTVTEMTEKLRSIKSLHNLASPMRQCGGGWIPDFQSRYFTADFPFGLAIIEEFARVLDRDVPNIRETMKWYRRITGDTSCFDLKRFGIQTIDDIYIMYEK